jgi:hypothetical protein
MVIPRNHLYAELLMRIGISSSEIALNAYVLVSMLYPSPLHRAGSCAASGASAVGIAQSMGFRVNPTQRAERDASRRPTMKLRRRPPLQDVLIPETEKSLAD